MSIPSFLKFIVIKLIGLKNIFFRNRISILSGNIIIDIIAFIIFFMIKIIFTFIFIKYLLNSSIYIKHPQKTAKNM